MTTNTFDPCGTEDSSGGCATCPMRTECLPHAEVRPGDVDYFADPGEPRPVEVRS